ncbi:hypothetical protein MA16_Dca026932 [Dendrobium catenatum]|uniref:Uncharacterized protein n=1 Tax=Dendrobium catenatum TaxID=906689 RepID=A0A2I0VVH9_9ASPA|nr:hypothetical protein MA16_Dca026932 [Dendrobium catenatum]
MVPRRAYSITNPQVKARMVPRRAYSTTSGSELGLCHEGSTPPLIHRREKKNLRFSASSRREKDDSRFIAISRGR